MKTQTVLSKVISTAGQKAAYDNVCKKILANKIILAWIMKSCLSEYRDCSIDEIAGQYIEGEPQISKTALHKDEQVSDTAPTIKGLNTEDASICEGTVTFDIRFNAVAPISGNLISLIINVEAQNDFYPGYPIIKRNIYYCSRMISAQYGTEFTNAHYEKIKKVYSIFICMNPPKNRKNTINKYSIKEDNVVGNTKEEKENYDLLTAIMLCLGDPEEKIDSEILRLLEVLLSSKRTVEEKKQILEKEYDIKMTETIESEVSKMCNLSDGVERQGIEKGLKQGLQQGLQTARYNDVKNLMKNLNLTCEQAIKALGISVKEWEDIKGLYEDDTLYENVKKTC